jgi:hypothetical protein
MTLIEIVIMIAIGLGAVVFSYKMMDYHESSADFSLQEKEKMEQTGKEISEKYQEEWERQQDECVQEVSNQLDHLSNEKILGFNEYSSQVFTKMDQSHEEVVFLYQMLTDKAKEVQDIVSRADQIKVQFQDEMAKEYQNVNVARSDRNDEENTKKETQNVFDAVTQTKRKQMIDDQDDLFESQDREEDSPSRNDSHTIFDSEKKLHHKSILSKENAKGDFAATPLAQNPQKEDVHQQIIQLSKQGCSILEISKMLKIGQGEVSLVLSLYQVS